MFISLKLSETELEIVFLTEILYIVHGMESINKWRVLQFDCPVPPIEITSPPIHLGNMAAVRCHRLDR
jgi:hypothetical protein